MASISLQAAYDQARQWLESNDLDRAVGLARHILDHYPDNLEAYRILGEAHLANRQLDRAQESFERVLRSDPENIPAHVGLGITSERQGQLDRAVAEFEQALEIKPDMAELRSQLLRLYTEGWGSEHAQLRLSRAGLARLYAKGHMLPQAISEFRQVIADQPGRFDAMVALAETLWRDGQEEDAITLCHDILAQRPESLKANLLLGYLLMTSGDPAGERYWRAAERMDPYHSVARALFETLPPGSDEQPQIEEWDEAGWRQRRAAEQQEQIAATRPMEAITPVGTAVAASVADQPPARPAPVAASFGGDDFLASLLAIETPALPPTPPQADISDDDLGLNIDMAPFSLEGLSDDQRPAPSAAESPAAPPAEDAEPTMTPFSLSDLGLSEDEIAGIDSLGAIEPAPAPAAETDEPAMTPFSLSDLGLSEDEIAGIDSLGAIEPASSNQPAEASEDDDITISPFSLSDLGLSEDEIAGLESLQTDTTSGAPPAPGAPEAGEEPSDMGDLPLDLHPFSIDELDLGAGEASSPGIGELPTSLQPFSLEEPPPQRPRVSGFISPESADNESIADEEDFTPETRGYSWQQASQKPETSFLKKPREEPSGDASIFAKLKQRHLTNPEEHAPPSLPPVSIDAEEHLGLFSLDDISLRDDSELAHPESPAPEPPATSAPEIDNLQDAVASGQVQPFSLADLGLSEEEIAAMGMGDATAAPASPPAPQQAEGITIDHVEFDPSGSDYTGECVLIKNTGTTSVDLTGWTLHDITAKHSFTFPPFLLAAGEVVRLWTRRGINDATNLYWDSIGAIWNNTGDTAILQDASGAEVSRFSFVPPSGPAPEPSAPPAPEPPAAPAPEIDNLEEAVAAGQIQPFSLADLGLSEEEIAAMGLGEPPAAPAPEIDNLEEAVAAGQIQPFSLADLGLSEEEIAAMGLADTAGAEAPAHEQPEPAPSAESSQEPDLLIQPLDAAPNQESPSSADSAEESSLLTSDLKPFSLTDLGLSEDEISALGLDESSDVDEGGTGLDITEEELEGLDGGDLNWASQQAEPAVPAAAQPESQLTSGDLVVDRLIALGRQQGYVDISDIMADFEDPEAEAGRIEEIGRLLHEAQVEIRDGDEVIDMDADYEEDQAETEAAEQTDEWLAAPDLPPPAAPSFPARDLDLATDDVDRLGLGQSGAPAPDTSAEQAGDEPSMIPFSLSELGLSEDEINSLGLEQPAAPAAPSALPDEPALTPFSLSELGLSDEEINALGLAEPPAPAEPSAPAEPEMTPFSLSELGLSDEEINALGLAEPPAPAEPSAPAEPEMTPFPLSELGLPDEQVGAPEQAADQPTIAASPESTSASQPEPQPAQPAPQPAPIEAPTAMPAATPPPRAAAPASRHADTEAPIFTGNDIVDAFLHQLEAEPQNDVLRISIARIGWQIGIPDLAVQQYKYLIKHSRSLDQVVDEVNDLLSDGDEDKQLQRLHRLLGDVYTKQGRFREAVEEYSWTLGRPRGAH